MAGAKKRSDDYKQGYHDGYITGQKSGYNKGRKISAGIKSNAYWIMKKDGWYCSNCKTKNEQKYDNYCCKCGCKMSEECDYEDN